MGLCRRSVHISFFVYFAHCDCAAQKTADEVAALIKLQGVAADLQSCQSQPRF